VSHLELDPISAAKDTYHAEIRPGVAKPDADGIASPTIEEGDWRARVDQRPERPVAGVTML